MLSTRAQLVTGGETVAASDHEGYDAAFFADLQDAAESSAQVVVPLLLSWLQPASVIDVGCGGGSWASMFQQHGVPEVVGVDGDYVDRGNLAISSDQFIAADLTQRFRMEESFDLAVSLEVAEHLSESRATTFVRDLVHLAPVVLFSAAIPHQGGTHHVNEQWPDYWTRHFAEHGFTALDILRPLIWDDARVAWWYRQNLLIFAAEAGLERWPDLRERARSLDSRRPMRLVHPERYLAWVEYAVQESRARWT